MRSSKLAIKFLQNGKELAFSQDIAACVTRMDDVVQFKPPFKTKNTFCIELRFNKDNKQTGMAVQQLYNIPFSIEVHWLAADNTSIQSITIIDNCAVECIRHKGWQEPIGFPTNDFFCPSLEISYGIVNVGFAAGTKDAS